MIAALTNHLWQSTIFAMAAGVLTVLLRKNRASVRHALWLTASLKFLVPFALLMNVGALAWTAAAKPLPPFAAPVVSAVVTPFAEPFAEAIETRPVTSAAPTNWLSGVLLSVWAIGLTTLVTMRVRSWRQIRAAVRASAPLPIALGSRVAVRSSAGLIEPGVVGLWRPILLLPHDIELQLTAAQLEAVLAHELHHVHRRDNLTSAIHMAVESVFWFHPLVWWISARLVDERERACDEYVLRVCGEPQAYAEGILSICKRYVESPVACVSGVTGSDLKRRIAHILTNRIGLRLNAARRIGLGLAAVAAFAIPVIAGAITAPVKAQAPSQGASATFDVASVKPCVVPPGKKPEHVETSPHRAYFECYTVLNLLDIAYTHEGNIVLNKEGPERNIRGGPDWIRSERYTIEATSGSVTWTGAMLRALLEDRFKVRSHRAVEEISMYALTVAKDGLKIRPMAAGDCTELDDSAPLPKPGQKPGCGVVSGRHVATDRLWEMGDASLAELADVLDTDARVVDKTGIDGRFNIRLQYSLDDRAPGGTSVFTALEEQLGLKLVKTKGPHDYTVVDHIERPVPDGPINLPARAGNTGGRRHREGRA